MGRGLPSGRGLSMVSRHSIGGRLEYQHRQRDLTNNCRTGMAVLVNISVRLIVTRLPPAFTVLSLKRTALGVRVYLYREVVSTTMGGEDEPVQHCTLGESVDLLEALAAAEIEHLDVDELRTIVIYRQSILMVIATAGQATAAREFDVEFWKESPDDPDQDPEEILAAFIDELVAITDSARH